MRRELSFLSQISCWAAHLPNLIRSPRSRKSLVFVQEVQPLGENRRVEQRGKWVCNSKCEKCKPTLSRIKSIIKSHYICLLVYLLSPPPHYHWRQPRPSCNQLPLHFCNNFLILLALSWTSTSNLFSTLQRQLSKSRCVSFVPLQNECLSTALKIKGNSSTHWRPTYLSALPGPCLPPFAFFTPAALALLPSSVFDILPLLVSLRRLNAFFPPRMFFLSFSSAIQLPLLRCCFLSSWAK